MSGRAKNFSDLAVYQKAQSLADGIFEATKGFPREEAYALTDQLRRASRSIGAQIAEAWGRRSYRRHFFSKLADADCEQLETRHWIAIAVDCGYLGEGPADEFLQQLIEIGRMLNSMMKKAELFCRDG